MSCGHRHRPVPLRCPQSSLPIAFVDSYLALREHFCPRPAPAQSRAAIAAIDAELYELWPPPPPGASALSAEQLADRIRGLVFGAALGDATGLATEFLTRADATAFYGPDFAFCP